MTRMGRSTLAGILALAVAAAAGCSRTGGTGGQAGPGAGAGSIRQIGSTTMLALAEKWRGGFNASHPDVSIAVSGGGSGTGIKALISGTAEIADSSRDVKAEEMKQAEAAGMKLVSHLVARDGMAVIVNPANPLREIPLAVLSDVYVGKTEDWGQAGAPGLGAIQIVSRDSASGTYEMFRETVVTLGGRDKSRDYAPEALKQTSNEAVLALVGQTKNAIGYVGLGYVNDTVKVVAIIPERGGAAVAPSAETVSSGGYPLARSLYCVTNGEPTGAVKTYLDWIKGAEGQAIVRELGFVPVGAP